ncbi:hypothetical protein AVEN_25639-1, partial [Araneus ventricosus]
KYSPCPF